MRSDKPKGLSYAIRRFWKVVDIHGEDLDGTPREEFAPGLSYRTANVGGQCKNFSL